MKTTEEFCKALKDYNGAQTADTQAALVAAGTDDRGIEIPCIVVVSGVIDIEESSKAREWFRETGYCRPGAQTVRVYIGTQMAAIEADVVTGEPLYQGKNPKGDDWGPIPQEDRETVAYGCLTGEVGGKSESVIFALKQSEPPPPWSRLRGEWKALRDKTNKTEADERLILAVKQRLKFHKPQRVPVVAPDPFAPITPRPMRDGLRPRLRAELRDRYRTYSDLDAFLTDYFPAIHHRVSAGMDRIVIENMLIESHETDLARMLGVS